MGATKTGIYNRLLQFLHEPEAYPHDPVHVEHIQTHISHVFIAPPYVYKLKKPVDLGFLDYSTLEKRKYYCEKELELNRRLCSEIYLGVVSIHLKGESFVLEPKEEGDPVEFAVKMKKLDDRHFLHTHIKNGSLKREHLDRVVERLAEFYGCQEPDREILKWGEIEHIRYNTDENFTQTEPFIGTTIDRNTFEAIRRFTDRYYEAHGDLFQKHINEKRIVDGHGDLHLDHIHITPERVCIYDCIEFNERFRYGDLAVDLAFLAMDLDFNDCWKEERYFLESMSDRLDDPDLLQITDFYKCYRAYVKGKVKSIQSEEEEVSRDDRERARETARRYFDLSLRYALLGSDPVVLIFMGRVGSGKSTLAEHVSGKLDIEHFSSDRIRKSLAGLPLYERTPKSKRPELYSPEMSYKTYELLREKAKENLKRGKSCLLDATFSNREGRLEMTGELESAGAHYLFVEAQASDDIIKERLKSREENDGVVSDARLVDFEELSKRYVSPEEINSDHLIGIDTDQPLDGSLHDLYAGLVDRHIKGLF